MVQAVADLGLRDPRIGMRPTYEAVKKAGARTVFDPDPCAAG